MSLKLGDKGKRILNFLGSAAALAGGIFVLLRLNDYSSQLDFSRFDSFMWSVVVGLSLLYGGANIMLALAWRNLLMYFGANIHRVSAVRIYGLTQLAKYVPGNIMHLASRQAMGMARGMSGRSLVQASIWEVGLIVIAGSVFAIFVLPQFMLTVTTLMVVLGFTGILLSIAVGLRSYLSLMISLAFGEYVVFLICSAAIFVGLIMLLKGEISMTPLSALIVGGAFILAWIAGLVTPGAPAGIGVREFVLTVLLKDLVAEGDLLFAVLLSRAITVCGDICFFLLASYFWRKKSGLGFCKI